MVAGKRRRTWRGPVTGAWGGRDRDGNKDAREDADMGGDIDPRGVSGRYHPQHWPRVSHLSLVITDHCPQAFPVSP